MCVCVKEQLRLHPKSWSSSVINIDYIKTWPQFVIILFIMYDKPIMQWCTGGFKPPPPRNSEVLTESNRIADWAENV